MKRSCWFKTHIDNIHVQTKFLLILLLALVFISAAVFATSKIPNRAYDEQLYASSVQMATLFAEKIQSSMDDMKELSFRILSDNVLQKNLSIMLRQPPNTTAWIEAKNEVSDRVVYFANWSGDTMTVQLRTAGGATFSSGSGNAAISSQLTAENIQTALDNKGQGAWIIEEGDPARLFLVREIREIEGLSLRTLGVILIQIDLSSLVERASDIMTRLDCPLRCAIYSEDICVYASDEQIKEIPASEDGYGPMTLDGESVLCVRITAANGWRYVTVVDYGRIRANIRNATVLSVALSVVAMLLAMTVCAVLVSNILKHLKALLEKFDAFAISGHPMPVEDNPYAERMDEIGQLHRHFDKMTRDYDHMTRDNYNKQLILQEKQMQQLRAQMRPHFIYNTLQSIYCLAKEAGDERVAVMTDALGKLLRASLNDKRDVITVAEDWQIACEYLRIQLMRYGERLKVICELDERFMPCQIPSMTLQPLVENAVHHAAEEMLDTCVIRLWAQEVEDGIELILEDNGPGMDEDILDKLESGEIKPEGLGIGMRNIHRRLQFAFTDRYGLRVRCAPGCTQIAIHLPGKEIKHV